MNEIICTGKDGIETSFVYSKEDTTDEVGNEKWDFRVYEINVAQTYWFEFGITRVNGTTGKVTTMDNMGKPQFIAMGIPDRMIEEASNVLELTIVSSSNNSEFKFFGNEWRSPKATNVWKRLAKINNATYDVRRDIYTFATESNLL